MKNQSRETIICRCEEVTEEEIVEAIREGAESLNDIKRRTRAGMGLCQGSSCRRIVSQILAEEQGRALGDIPPSTFRPPVRPIKLGVLATEIVSQKPKLARNNIGSDPRRSSEEK